MAQDQKITDEERKRILEFTPAGPAAEEVQLREAYNSYVGQRLQEDPNAQIVDFETFRQEATKPPGQRELESNNQGGAQQQGMGSEILDVLMGGGG